MSAIPFLVSIDLNQNELLRAVLQNEAANPDSPAPKAGQLYFNTADNKPYYFDGFVWIDFSGGVESITGGKGVNLTGTVAGVVINVDVDDASIYIDPDTNDGKVKIKPLGVLTSHIANSNVTTLKIANSNVTFAKIQELSAMVIMGNITGSPADVAEITIVTTIDDEDDTEIPTHGAVKRYVDAAITALGVLVGDWDASVSTFPTVGSGDSGAVVKGDYYYITVAGTMGTHSVNVGDVLYAQISTPGQTSTNWFVVEANRDQATETALGLAKLCTNAQVLAGTNDLTIVTPLKLQAKLVNYYTASNGASVKDFLITGDNSATQFILTHSFNTYKVKVEIYEETTKDTIIAHITRNTVDQVTVTFNTAPALAKEYNAIVVAHDETIV